MKSAASIKSHPLHPMLICFPIAFLSAAFIFDCLALVTGNMVLTQLARVLNPLGVVSGLIAGVPGFIDYLSIVPPKSSAARRSLQHMGANVAALVVFFAAWLARPGDLPVGAGIVLLELAGIVLLTIGGWHGGTLVYRNQIGVDHRYAFAGKWREEHIPASGAAPVRVAGHDELKAGQMKLVHHAGLRLVLGRGPDGYFAFEDRCTHKGGPLSDGTLIGSCVACPWHGSQFDITSGAVKAGPAAAPIATFKVEETESGVFLRLD